MEREQSGFTPDPFWSLVCEARAAGHPPATVESKVSHWGNNVSVSFSVSLQCDQSKQHIEAAAQLAFTAATRFVNEAVARFDSSMPMLPTV